LGPRAIPKARRVDPFLGNLAFLPHGKRYGHDGIVATPRIRRTPWHRNACLLRTGGCGSGRDHGQGIAGLRGPGIYRPVLRARHRAGHLRGGNDLRGTHQPGRDGGAGRQGTVSNLVGRERAIATLRTVAPERVAFYWPESPTGFRSTSTPRSASSTTSRRRQGPTTSTAGPGPTTPNCPWRSATPGMRGRCG
jgi:hypothetical protein